MVNKEANARIRIIYFWRKHTVLLILNLTGQKVYSIQSILISLRAKDQRPDKGSMAGGRSKKIKVKSVEK